MDSKDTRSSRGSSDTRAALLASAAGLLEEGGMAAVTLRAVGKRAGISRQAPYRHYADKEALLSAIAAGYFGQLGEEMTAAARSVGDDPFGRLEAIAEAYVRFALSGPNRYRLMFGPEIRDNPHPEVHEAARAVHEWFVRAVAGCQEAEQLPEGDPVELAALIGAAGHGAVDRALAGHVEEEKGLGDPSALVRLLLLHLRAARRP